MRPHLRDRIAGKDSLGAEEGGFQIDQDGPVEIAFGELVDAAHDRDPGVVDEDVDRAKVTRDLFDHFCDRGGLRYIGGDGDGAAAIGLDPGDDGFGVSRALTIIDRDGGAEFSECDCNRGANAARAARHQRDMRAQILFRH